MIDIVAWSSRQGESDALAHLPPSPPIIYDEARDAYVEAYWETLWYLRGGLAQSC